MNPKAHKDKELKKKIGRREKMVRGLSDEEDQEELEEESKSDDSGSDDIEEDSESDDDERQPVDGTVGGLDQGKRTSLSVCVTYNPKTHTESQNTQRQRTKKKNREKRENGKRTSLCVCRV